MPVARSSCRLLLGAALVALIGCGPGAGPVPWPKLGGGGGADLVEAGFSHTPDQLVLNTRATMHVSVANVGTEAAGPFDVVFAVTPNGNRTAWPPVHVDGLAAGATTVVDFEADIVSTMDIPIEIDVDPDNTVREANEGNNVSRHTETVASSG